MEIFRARGFHHLVVRERGRLVGVISDRDVLRERSTFIDTLAERTQDVETLKKRVHRLMSRKLVTARESEAVSAAAARMLEAKVSCLPVLDAGGELVGIVTMRDLLRALVTMGAR